MNTFFIAACSLFILLGYEIRYRMTVDEVTKLKDITSDLEKEVSDLKEQVKLKKNIYDDVKP